MEEEFLHGQMGVTARQRDAALARAEAAEAEVARLRSEIDHVYTFLIEAAQLGKSADALLRRFDLTAMWQKGGGAMGDILTQTGQSSDDCRTTEEQMGALEGQINAFRSAFADLREQISGLANVVGSLHEHQVLDARRVDKLQQRINQTDDALTGQIARLMTRMDALADQVRAEAQGNSAAFGSIDRILSEHQARLEALESVNSPWPLLNETAVNLETLRQTIDYLTMHATSLETP